MPVNHTHSLVEDPEFKRMSQPLLESEYFMLEGNIINSNVRPVIEVWHRMILTDFDTYHICRHNRIPFQTKELYFNSRTEAIYYAAKVHLDFRNNSSQYQRYCTGKCYLAMKVIIKKMYKHPELSSSFKELNIIISKSPDKRVTSADAGTIIFGLSQTTISQYGKFAEAVDKISLLDPLIAKKILSKELCFSIKDTIELSTMQPYDRLQVCRKKNKDFSIPINSSFFRPEVPETLHVKSPIINDKVQNEPEIKRMPEYDPDAEISSLTYTIPTWISSINRATRLADFSKVSLKAKEKLSTKLCALEKTIQEIQRSIKE